MERVECSPVFSPSVIILKTPLHHLHIVPYDFLSFVMLIGFKLSFIIHSDDLLIPVIHSSIDHVSFELEPLFDIFIVDHPVWVRKFIHLLCPIIPEYAGLVLTQVAKENLCSPPIHDPFICHIAIQIVREGRLIDFYDTVKEPSEDIEACLLRQKVVAKQKY